MITLLRKIRKRLISKGSFTSYLLYAIGEIFLVMIGILLALQVNNWNGERNKQKQEIKLLTQLNSDLRFNLEEIKGLYQKTKIRSESKDSILLFLTDAEKHRDQLRYHLHIIQLSGLFNMAETSYRSIAAGDINVLSNDTLRANISDMYEYHFHNIFERQKMERYEIDKHLNPVMHAEFIPTPSHSFQAEFLGDIEVLNFPKNAKALRQNSFFINALTGLQTIATARRNLQQVTITMLEDLIVEVDEDIGRLKGN